MIKGISAGDKVELKGFNKEKANNPIDYAIFVEEGSRNNKANHMLRKAATEHTEEYKKIMEDALKNA